MTLSTDAKFGLGVVLATILIIGGGAWYASRNASTGTTSDTVVGDTSRLVREDDPVLGATENVAVTVVEFGDFECPACGALHRPLKAVKQELADQPVQFSYRHFPLAQHDYAQLAAEAAVAAQAQGKFWEYHDLLFENQQNLERAALERHAEQLGLNMDQFKEALDNNTHRDTVQQDIGDGRSLGVNSTPTLYINGKQYQGAFAVDALKSAIEAELPSE